MSVHYSSYGDIGIYGFPLLIREKKRERERGEKRQKDVHSLSL